MDAIKDLYIKGVHTVLLYCIELRIVDLVHLPFHIWDRSLWVQPGLRAQLCEQATQH